MFPQQARKKQSKRCVFVSGHSHSQVGSVLTQPREPDPSMGTWDPFSPHCSEALVYGFEEGQGECKRH